MMTARSTRTKNNSKRLQCMGLSTRFQEVKKGCVIAGWMITSWRAWMISTLEESSWIPTKTFLCPLPNSCRPMMLRVHLLFCYSWIAPSFQQPTLPNVTTLSKSIWASWKPISTRKILKMPRHQKKWSNASSPTISFLSIQRAIQHWLSRNSYQTLSRSKITRECLIPSADVTDCLTAPTASRLFLAWFMSVIALKEATRWSMGPYWNFW